MLSHLPLFFSSSFLLLAVLPPKVFQQKYVLQKRNSQGYFVQVATFDKPVSSEDVWKEFGDGYFILRSCKPRFATTWKGWLGEPDPGNKQQRRSSSESDALLRLQRKTKFLTYGLAATAAGEIIGFPLIHFRFNKLENQIAQLVAVSQTLPAQGLHCPNCQSTLDNMLQNFCTSCGVPLAWPKYPPTIPPDLIGQCWSCKRPLRAHHKFCPTCGQPKPTQVPLPPPTWSSEAGLF